MNRNGLAFHLLDVLFNIVVIVAIVGGIRTFLVSPFQVEGASMTATLEDREYIIINKLSYFLGQPERGDIVVFRPPNDHNKYYVKRVIGEPGDTVIIRDGRVYLQTKGETASRELAEPYLDEKNAGRTYRHPSPQGDQTEARFTVPEDRYFLLGDNRQGSLDSRSFTGQDGKPDPYVPTSDIKGKVWFVALPLTKIHAIAQPAY